MNQKIKAKIKALQRSNDLSLVERIKLILALKELILREAHICPNFEEVVGQLSEFLKTGNGIHELVAKRLVNEISQNLQYYLDKAEAEK